MNAIGNNHKRKYEAENSLDNKRLCLSKSASVHVESLFSYRELIDACNGNSQMLTKLGLRYSYGVGLNQDYTKAYECFLEAAFRNNREALYNLGLMLEAGLGVQKNDKEARKCYIISAQLGSAIAKDKLSKAYLHLGFRKLRGKGASKSVSQAFKCFQAAAGLGDAKGLNNAAVMFASGTGILKNETNAVILFKEAIKLGSAEACCNFAQLKLKQGSEEEAKKHFKLAAQEDNIIAICRLGMLYLKNKKKDKALACFKKAADYGCKQAELLLANPKAASKLSTDFNYFQIALV